MAFDAAQASVLHDPFAVQRIYEGLHNNPAAPGTMVQLLNVWDGLTALEQTEGMSSLVLRRNRSCVMMTNLGVWLWLDRFIVQQCKNALEPGYAGSSDWIGKLARTIYSMRDARGYIEIDGKQVQSRDFIASDFDPAFPTLTYHYQAPVPRIRNRETEDELKEVEKVSSIAVDIVAAWLKFPTGTEAVDGRRKASVVEILVAEFGPYALLLDHTWKLYTAGKRKIYWETNIGQDSGTDLFKVAARGHPLSVKTSRERETLDALGNLCTSIIQMPIIPKIPHKTNNRAITLPKASTLPKAIMAPLTQPVQDNGAGALRFRKYIREMVSMQMDRIAEEDMTKLHRTVRQLPDKLLPFRELAPSRRRFAGSDSPFSPENILTDEGFFSALIWRGITYSTEFSLTKQMMFKDLEDWKQTLEEERKTHTDPIYFCDTTAYGIANAGRTLDLADEYWEVIKVHKLASFIAKDSNFGEVYTNFFKPGTARFRNFGPLTAFLLTSDYAYHNRVDMPTLDEVAQAVRTINRGAARGLELAGLMKLRKRGGKQNKANLAKISDVQGGVKAAYAILKEEISEADWKALGVDEIVLENTLCKFSKAVKRGLI